MGGASPSVRHLTAHHGSRTGGESSGDVTHGGDSDRCRFTPLWPSAEWSLFLESFRGRPGPRFTVQPITEHFVNLDEDCFSQEKCSYKISTHPDSGAIDRLSLLSDNRSIDSSNVAGLALTTTVNHTKLVTFS